MPGPLGVEDLKKSVKKLKIVSLFSHNTIVPSLGKKTFHFFQSDLGRQGGGGDFHLTLDLELIPSHAK